MIGLTKRQADCLQAITDLTVDGVSPSFTEIAARLDVTSKSVVHRLVTGLEKRGHLRRYHHAQRALEVIEPLRPLKSKTAIAEDVCNRARQSGLISDATPESEAALRSIVLEALA
jgi:repressor LexA